MYQILNYSSKNPKVNKWLISKAVVKNKYEGGKNFYFLKNVSVKIEKLKRSKSDSKKLKFLRQVLPGLLSYTNTHFNHVNKNVNFDETFFDSFNKNFRKFEKYDSSKKLLKYSKDNPYYYFKNKNYNECCYLVGKQAALNSVYEKLKNKGK